MRYRVVVRVSHVLPYPVAVFSKAVVYDGCGKVHGAAHDVLQRLMRKVLVVDLLIEGIAEHLRVSTVEGGAHLICPRIRGDAVSEGGDDKRMEQVELRRVVA
jgi:hypothetical protein